MKKTCEYCGKEFETNNKQKKYCDGPHYRPCPVCGNPVKMTRPNDFSVSPKCCSKECVTKLRKSKFKQKKCKYCGKLFTPESGRSLYCKGPHYAVCEVCGKTFEIPIHKIVKGVTTCSHECEVALTKRHNIEKYGVEHPMQLQEVKDRYEKTMNDRYGVRYALQNPELKKKASDSIYEKFGTRWALSNSDIKRKSMNTMLEKYGAKTTLQSPELIEKVRRTNLNRYGFEIATKSEEVKKKTMKTCIERYGVPYAIHNNNNSRVSSNNVRFHDILLNEFNIDSTYEKFIEPYYYDISIEQQKTLIEIDPTYTHNTNGNHWNPDGISSEYHLAKTELAESNGYRCIHIFDWDNWNDIVRLLKPCDTVVYARNCKIFKLNQKVCNQFLRENHLQGSNRGNLLCLGLVCDDEIVQVMTFGQPRYNKNYNAELLRLCSKKGTRVIGGASKLFKFATVDYGIDNIISYCDRSKFTGDVYEKIGMTLCNVTPPNCVWSKGEKKVTANLLRQRGYDQLFGTNYGKGTDNEQLMLDNGWLPVYDCGQKVFEYRSKK